MCKRTWAGQSPAGYKRVRPLERVTGADDSSQNSVRQVAIVVSLVVVKDRGDRPRAVHEAFLAASAVQILQHERREHILNAAAGSCLNILAVMQPDVRHACYSYQVYIILKTLSCV